MNELIPDPTKLALMDEEKRRTLLKYVKDQKTESDTLARELDTQRANKNQKARTEKDPDQKYALSS